jgi:hypothetical protein
MLGYDGVVHAFGQAPHCGNTYVSMPYSYGADIEPFPDGTGYWVLDGENYVDVVYCGDDFFSKGYHINAFFEDRLLGDERPVSMSSLPDGSGYWVFTDQGRALPFGDAQFYGDMGGAALRGPILDSIATPSGRGYWMVASDGGIFAFGDATFSGSMGGQPLNEPVMAMAPDADGQGYWLVASDGGIFAFGDATFSGSMGGQPLNEPVMAMAPDADGRGYWLVASDGGIFAFDAPFYGSMGNVRLNQDVTGMVASPTGGGYLMVAADGGAFTFGDVPFHGSLGANPPSWPITSIAVMR